MTPGRGGGKLDVCRERPHAVSPGGNVAEGKGEHKRAVFSRGGGQRGALLQVIPPKLPVRVTADGL